MDKNGCSKELLDRTKYIGGTPIDEGDGYWSLIGKSPTLTSVATSMLGMASGFSGEVAYVQLPKGHEDIGKDEGSLDPPVNGGLTYSDGPVFGWDYGHAYNSGTPKDDIKGAIEYFKSRDKR